MVGLQKTVGNTTYLIGWVGIYNENKNNYYRGQEKIISRTKIYFDAIQRKKMNPQRS
jgi:hypothetical protein